MRKRDLLLPLTTVGSAAFMIGLIVAGFLIIQTSTSLPDAQKIKSVELKIPLRVYSAENQLIAEFGNERRKPIAIEETPQLLIDAVLASEDDGFFRHGGIDVRGLFRAALSNFSSGETQQGASTITMQVARNFFLTREKTYLRKLREVLLAIKLEQILSKQEILSLYLNKIFLGHRAYGFGAAADVYYGKPLAELSTAEIAMLAGLPKAPSSNNPLRNPERAVTRRNYVLNRLFELGKIDQETFQSASNAPVTAEKHARVTDLAAPHIAEMVRAQLIEELGEDTYWQGLNVYTTIQAPQQRAATAALRNGLQAYDRRHGFRGPIAQIDLNAVEPADDQTSPYFNVLSGYPNSGEQIPALILSVDSEVAQAQTKDHGAITLSLKDAKWAKRHLTANRVSDAPRRMGQLLTAGDIVYVQPIADSTAPAEKPAEQAEQIAWRLSQIPNVSGALISIDPGSGRILSLVGGYDFFLNKYNRAVQSIRQPGSNIKPFIYSAALDKEFSPATLISGAPIVITDPTHGTVWRPENYSGEFYGPTRMREALSKSMNLVSVRLLRAIGVPYAREYTERFGIDMNRFSPTLTMALGSGGITPLEMLRAYSTLANTGYLVEPYFIDYITDREGRIVYRAAQPEYCDECYAEYLVEPDEDAVAVDVIDQATETNEQQQELPAAPEQQAAVDAMAPEPSADVPVQYYQAPRVMSRANNFLTVSMLKDVVRRGTARKALALKREDLAGKTGTTNDYVDAWFTGFNSKVATTVWVGFDDPATMGRGEAGSKAALPIWIDYMQSALADVPADTEQLPDFIQPVFVNRYSGKVCDESDPDAIPEFTVLEEMLPPLERALYAAEFNAETEDDQQLGESGEDTLQDPVVPLDQQERIIEETEDTEGLF